MKSSPIPHPFPHSSINAFSLSRYRAKIKKVNADKTVDVDYIDFGNSETISTSRIRALDAGFSVSKLPAQAMEVQLAFISIPSLDSDYGPEAYEHLRTLTEQKNLKFVEIGKDKTTGVKTLFLVDNSDFSSNSIQESMLRDGWATVDKKLKRQYDYEQRSMTQAALAAEQRNVVSHGRTSAASNKTLYEVVKALIDAQEVAQKTRKGMMEYGDMADDEEDFSR